jgi:hypothetical protein
MIYFKACPRCRGDLVLEATSGDSELVCLQCSFRSSPAAVTGVNRDRSRKAVRSENTSATGASVQRFPQGASGDFALEGPVLAARSPADAMGD